MRFSFCFLGPVTSTLDWCEENYVVSHYVAEFWNTISNVVFLALSMFGVATSHSLGLGERAVLSYLAVAVVGAGSFLFHGTLWYETQLMDELPMIYSACILDYCLLNAFQDRFKTLSGIVLSLYAVTVTVVYLYVRNPVFHELSYALLVAFMVVMPVIQIRYLKQLHADEARRAKRLKLVSRTDRLWLIYAYSVVSFMSGFLVWNVENQFCETFRTFRQDVGYPLRVVSELHSWWHIGTGVGTYGCVTMITYLRCLAVGRDDVRLKFAFGVLPVVTTTPTKIKQK
ncbi:alkaline ceramidase 3 [Zopfochytrium polystomum]|nr:alkaline ceramidase 3 [Zopfochytrium polystomum]